MVQVENHLKRSDGDFDVLPYHNAIADDVRPRNLQVKLRNLNLSPD